MDSRVCRRCLLREMSEDAFQNVYEYIDSLDEAVRTPETEYARRLRECRTCGELLSGMCRLCGCFVEVRAAKRGLSCPASPPRW